MTTQIWADGQVGAMAGTDAWGQSTVVACDRSRGRIWAVNTTTGLLDQVWRCDGYDRPIGISVTDDRALITEQSGAVLLQNLAAPGREHATVLANGIGEPHQIIPDNDGAAALIADRSGGRVLRIDVDNGTVGVVASGLSQPVGLALALDGTLFVTERNPGSLTRIAADGSRSTVLAGLMSPAQLSWLDDERSELLVTEQTPANRVGLVRLSENPVALRPLVSRSITNPAMAIIAENHLVVTGDQRLLAFDIAGALHGDIAIVMPEPALWPTAWSDIEVDTGVSGYLREGIKLSVDPPGFGAVSEHLPADADDRARTMFRLLAGGTPGTGDIVVSDAVTNAELNRTPFEIGVTADTLADGPSQWIDGPTGPPPVVRALALRPGVDDPNYLGLSILRNRDGTPKRQWNVLAVLVDTGSSVWASGPGAAANPPTAATARAAWKNFFTGVRNYWSEVSNNLLTVQLVNKRVYGPVHLGETWTRWLTESDEKWDIDDDVCDTVVASIHGDSTIDWANVDSVLIIMRSAGNRFVWPTASVGKTAANTTERGGFLPIPLARIAMPHEYTNLATWPLPHLHDTAEEVLCHEMGHNLGLPDLYMSDKKLFTTEMRARDLDDKELMSDEGGFPHLSARHKSLLGFLGVDRIRSFTYGFAETDTVTLQAISDNSSPPFGRAAIELKVAPKKSWFFEYRQNIPGTVGDQAGVFAGGTVICYDALNYRDPPTVPIARTPIVLLANDDDADGPVLTAVGQDYVAINTDDPDGPVQFRLEVLSILPDRATVRVTVGQVDRPDPMIRSAPGNGDFRSPDIEVRPDVPGLDPAWRTKPRVDVNNTIIAKVTNAGSLNAPNVSVRFSVRGFNTDDPDSDIWEVLGEPVVADVDAGKTLDFVKEGWRPHDPYGHYCVQARIDRYVNVAGALADEPDVDNNLAQSNYAFMFSVALSPASRETSRVEVRNPYSFPATAAIELRQEVEGYRAYVDHRWIRLQPNEIRHINVQIESKATSVEDIIEHRYPDGRAWIRAWFRGNHDHVNHTGTGVTLDISTAVATQVAMLPELLDHAVLFQVASVTGGFTPPAGTVLVSMEYDDGVVDTRTSPIDGDGIAEIPIRSVAGEGYAFFSGTARFAHSQVDIMLPGHH